jgi:hypothetical protein
VTSYYQSFPAVKVTAKVCNLDASEKFSKEVSTDVGPDSSTRVFVLPNLKGLSSTYFVSLMLAAPDHHTVSRNLYAISVKDAPVLSVISASGSLAFLLFLQSRTHRDDAKLYWTL